MRGTPEPIAAIAAADLRDFVADRFAKDVLLIGRRRRHHARGVEAAARQDFRRSAGDTPHRRGARGRASRMPATPCWSPPADPAMRRRVRPARHQARRSRLVCRAARQLHSRRRRLDLAPGARSAREARPGLFGLHRARSAASTAASSSAVSAPKTPMSPSRSTSSAPSGSACTMTGRREGTRQSQDLSHRLVPADARFDRAGSPACSSPSSATISASTISTAAMRSSTGSRSPTPSASRGGSSIRRAVLRRGRSARATRRRARSADRSDRGAAACRRGTAAGAAEHGAKANRALSGGRSGAPRRTRAQ